MVARVMTSVEVYVEAIDGTLEKFKLKTDALES